MEKHMPYQQFLGQLEATAIPPVLFLRNAIPVCRSANRNALSDYLKTVIAVANSYSARATITESVIFNS